MAPWRDRVPETKPYRPVVMDTAAKLPPEFENLIESLASNIHDVWASQRMREGWTYGPQRDDARKTHPDLVPYADLPESEKSYDRNTATETIRRIVSLGYGFTKIEDGRTQCLFQDGPEAVIRECTALRKAGESLSAYDKIHAALAAWPADPGLRRLAALVLADLGATERANAILRTLLNEGHRDAETLGILARTHKDLALAAGDAKERKSQLTEALRLYAQSFREHKGYYAGINAATLAMLLGQADDAVRLAGAVDAQCRRAMAATPSPHEAYYLTATLGEAALLLGHADAAAQWYHQAATLGRGNWKDIHSTKRNARLLLACRGGDASAVEDALRLPATVLFCGQRLDAPGRPDARFPDDPALVAAVAEALASRAKTLDLGFGFASGAAGGDILFLETVLRQGAEARLVLPFDREHFVEQCVARSGAGDWPVRFAAVHDALEPLGRVACASDWPVGGGEDFDFAQRYLLGAARLNAARLGSRLVALALWDGRPDDAPGGPAAAARRWEQAGVEYAVIDLAAIRQRVAGIRLDTPASVAPARDTGAAAPLPGGLKPEIMTMLFADVAGYSRLREEQIPPFMTRFMGGVAELADRFGPVMRNTWGDGLFCVFADPRAAGCFALELAAFVSRTPWPEFGLPGGLGIRTALHSGPVYRCQDPVLGRPNYTGTHISRAARFEPITPKGQVYASEAFAVLATASGVEDFACEYVGRIELAKHYGVFPAYLVRRAAQADAVCEVQAKG